MEDYNNGLPFIQEKLYHVAMISDCDNTQTKYYINGKLSATIGGYYPWSGGYYHDYIYPNINLNMIFGRNVCIDELRISNCIRWTENFIPPTKPYTI